jgi:hypothetical protein
VDHFVTATDTHTVKQLRAYWLALRGVRCNPLLLRAPGCSHQRCGAICPALEPAPHDALRIGHCAARPRGRYRRRVETHQRQIEAALEAATLRREQLSDLAVVVLFAEIRGQMGAGELATLVVARQKGWAIAPDEKKELRRQALARPGGGRILTVPGIYVTAIEASLLSVEEADATKRTLKLSGLR